MSVFEKTGGGWRTTLLTLCLTSCLTAEGAEETTTPTQAPAIQVSTPTMSTNATEHAAAAELLAKDERADIRKFLDDVNMAPGTPADWRRLCDELDSHLREYAEVPTIADRALTFLYMLHRRAPGIAAEYARHLRSFPVASVAEAVGWEDFLRDYYEVKKMGGKDWGPFFNRFSLHASEHADQGDILARRAKTFLWDLENFAPHAAEEGWQTLVNSPVERLRSLAAAQLAMIAAVKPPLEIKFTAVDGREVSLAALRGKVVVIDFWATWCKPCVDDLPRLKALYDMYHSQGLEIVGISCDLGKKRLTDFIQANGIDWPQQFDGLGWENEYRKTYRLTGIPTKFLLDQQGVLISRNIYGYQLEGEVRRLLGLPAPALDPFNDLERRLRSTKATTSIGFVSEDGITHTFPDFSGRPLLIDVWATWCANCVASLPATQASLEKFQENGLQVIGICQVGLLHHEYAGMSQPEADRAQKRKMRQTLESKKITFPNYEVIFHDSKESVIKDYGILGARGRWLLDKNGIILAGPSDLSSDDKLYARLRELLQLP